MNAKIDHSKIEQEIRQLVDFIAVNPEDFSQNKLGIVAIPTELAKIAYEFARDKDLENIFAFDDYLASIPNEAFKTFKLPTETAYYTELEVTPADSLACLKQGLGSDCVRFQNVIQVAENLLAFRESAGLTFYNDYTDQIPDYKAVHIVNLEHKLLPKIKFVIDDAIEINRPKTKLEKQLEKILTEHYDIEVSEPDTEAKAPRKTYYLGKTESGKSISKGKVDALVKRIHKSLFNEDSDSWDTAIFDFKAYNAVSKNSYNVLNTMLLKDYVDENKYETGVFLSTSQAFEMGLGIDRGSEGHLIFKKWAMQGSPVEEIKNGEKVQKVEDGVPQFYWRKHYGAISVFNLDQFKWEKDGPDPRDALKAEYHSYNRVEPKNADQIKLFNDVVIGNILDITVHRGGTRNSYNADEDEINMALSEMFKSPLRESTTALHEYCHAGGHEMRNNRESIKRYGQSSAWRGKEEFIANASQRILTKHYGLVTDETSEHFEKNNDVYDIGWAKAAFKDNPDEILFMIDDIQKNVEIIRKAIDHRLTQENVYDVFVKPELVGKPEDTDEPTQEKKSTYKRSVKYG